MWSDNDDGDDHVVDAAVEGNDAGAEGGGDNNKAGEDTLRPAPVVEGTVTEDNPSGYTQEQLDRIAAIEKECNEVFPPRDRGNTFDTPLGLKDAFQQVIGDKYGFKLALVGSSLRCTRAAQADNVVRRKEIKRMELPPEKHRGDRRTIRCNCKFRVNFTKYHGGREAPGIDSGGEGLPPQRAVFVTKGFYVHSNGCSGTLEGVVPTGPPRKQKKKHYSYYKRKDGGAPTNEAEWWRAPEADRDGRKNYGQIVNHLRPLASVLAGHPQQKAFLSQLDSMLEIARGPGNDGNNDGDGNNNQNEGKGADAAISGGKKGGGNNAPAWHAA